jgi:hypothetical protein
MPFTHDQTEGRMNYEFLCDMLEQGAGCVQVLLQAEHVAYIV